MAKDDYMVGTYSKLVAVEEQKKKTVSPTALKKTKDKKIETMTPRYHATTQPSNQDSMVETVRKAVKQLGKEAATYRFTQQEKKSLADLVYSYKGTGIKTSENEITRISINYLVEDYRENGKNSILERVIDRLNA